MLTNFELIVTAKTWLGYYEEYEMYPWLIELEPAPDNLPYMELDDLTIQSIVQNWDRKRPLDQYFKMGVPVHFPVSVLNDMLDYFAKLAIDNTLN